LKLTKEFGGIVGLMRVGDDDNDVGLRTGWVLCVRVRRQISRLESEGTWMLMSSNSDFTLELEFEFSPGIKRRGNHDGSQNGNDENLDDLNIVEANTIQQTRTTHDNDTNACEDSLADLLLTTSKLQPVYELR
jgi:hypothetical protein